MSTDGFFERTAILLRGKELLFGGRFHDSVPDDARLERNALGLPKPYAVLHVGTIYAQNGDRSIMGEEDQPHVMPFSIAVYAPTAEVARSAAGSVREVFIGWAPSPASDPISAPGGTAYRDRDAAGTPTLAVEVVGLETVINLGDLDGYVPTPGGLEPGGAAVATIEQVVADYLASHVISPGQRFDFPVGVGAWPMSHALGRVPDVALFDLLGRLMLTDVQATSTQVVATWASPTPGFAILT